MLRYNQKSGDLALTPSALTGLALVLFGFGGWMTKMQIDVSHVYDISERISHVEKALVYNHLDITRNSPWPVTPSPSSPLSPYSSLPVVALDRRVPDSETP